MALANLDAVLLEAQGAFESLPQHLLAQLEDVQRSLSLRATAAPPLHGQRLPLLRPLALTFYKCVGAAENVGILQVVSEKFRRLSCRGFRASKPGAGKYAGHNTTATQGKELHKSHGVISGSGCIKTGEHLRQAKV